MKIFTEEDRQNLILFWKSKQFENFHIGAEIVKSRTEEMTPEELKELNCLSLLVNNIYGNAEFIDPQDVIYSIHFFSRDNISLKKLGFQGTRILKRNKKNVIQFFCGRSKPSLEIELTKPIYKQATNEYKRQPI